MIIYVAHNLWSGFRGVIIFTTACLSVCMSVPVCLSVRTLPGRNLIDFDVVFCNAVDGLKKFRDEELQSKVKITR